MSNKWILLVGVILAVHLAPTTTLTELTDSVDGDDLSPQGLGPAIGQRDQGNEKTMDATTIPVSDTGPESKIMLPPTRRRRAASTWADNLLWSLAAAPSNLVKSILYVPTSIVEAMTNRVMGMAGNLANVMMIKSWEIAKNWMIPKLDEYLMKMTTMDAVPEELKEMIISAHSTYSLLKLFGFLKPA